MELRLKLYPESLMSLIEVPLLPNVLDLRLNVGVVRLVGGSTGGSTGAAEVLAVIAEENSESPVRTRIVYDVPAVNPEIVAVLELVDNICEPPEGPVYCK